MNNTIRKYYPQPLYAHGQIIGNRDVTLHLPACGTAYITTSIGRANIRIKESPQEPNRILCGIRGKTTLIIGDLTREHIYGKDSLRKYLSGQGSDETLSNWIGACCRALAEKAGILPGVQEQR